MHIVKVRLNNKMYDYLKQQLNEERIEKSMMAPDIKTPTIAERIETIVGTEIVAEKSGRHPIWNPDPERNMLIREWKKKHPHASFNEFITAYADIIAVKTQFNKPDRESMR